MNKNMYYELFLLKKLLKWGSKVLNVMSMNIGLKRFIYNWGDLWVIIHALHKYCLREYMICSSYFMMLFVMNILIDLYVFPVFS